MSDQVNVEEAIRTSYVAQGLSDEQLDSLIRIAHLRAYKDGEVILQQFDDSSDLMILAEGRAHVVTVVGEPIGMIRSGMPLGEVSFLDERPRSVSVISVGDTVVATMPAKPLRSLLDRDPALEIALLRNLSRVLCTRLRSANNNLAALMAIDESEAAMRQNP